MAAFNKHDDVEYEVDVLIGGEKHTQQVFGVRNEKLAREEHRKSVEANNKAHPHNKIEIQSWRRKSKSSQETDTSTEDSLSENAGEVNV